MEKGSTNGWDMKLPGGQHPLRALDDWTALNQLRLELGHIVRLNPELLNTLNKILKYQNKISTIKERGKKEASNKNTRSGRKRGGKSVRTL